MFSFKYILSKKEFQNFTNVYVCVCACVYVCKLFHRDSKQNVLIAYTILTVILILWVNSESSDIHITDYMLFLAVLSAFGFLLIYTVKGL